MEIMAYIPFGGDGIVIRVEADIRRGIPGVDISGLALGAVREARERVRVAFRNAGFRFPQDRVLINLAPAGIRKDGTSLDLPIALAVMLAAGMVPGAAPPFRDGSAPAQGEGGSALMVLGELELSGRLRPVRGVLAAVDAGLRRGIRRFIVPAENGREAAILIRDHPNANADWAAASTLAEAAGVLMEFARAGSFPGHGLLPPPPSSPDPAAVYGDFAEVRGQGRYKRAMEIAAAGGHNMLIFGPPGAGKTMLARRMPSIMAPLDPWEAVEVTRLHSLAGNFLQNDYVRDGFGQGAFGRGGFGQDGPEGEWEPGEAEPWEGGLSPGGPGLRENPAEGLITHPPFRSPHHSASAEGILGGGKHVRPGEISLAHFGVLFMDEAPEFRSNVLQALREPLEDRVLTISRAEGPVRLPADFQLVLAANPCPCGKLGRRAGNGAAQGNCFCGADEIQRYWRRFSGALLDRIELRVAVMPPETERLDRNDEEPGSRVAERVRRAVAVQQERFAGLPPRRNAGMSPSLVERFCPMTAEARRSFHAAMDRLGFSGRAFHGCLRTARTIADLEGAETIAACHIREAVELRRQGEDPYDIFSPEDV